MPRVLILAYGNPLRGDDGVAWYAAEELQKMLPSSLAEFLFLHQLTPELAEPISLADVVVFLDAACRGRPGTITSAHVSPEPYRPEFSHQLTPQSLLGLSQRLYSGRPRAFAVSMTGQSFDPTETLSDAAREALPRLVSTVHERVRLILRDSARAALQ